MAPSNDYHGLAKEADAKAATATNEERRQHWHDMAQKYRAMAAELLRHPRDSASEAESD